MSDYDEYGPPDGICVNCGEPTEQDHHWRCRDCYRRHMGVPEPPAWHQPRPAPGPPPSFVEGLAQVRGTLQELILLVASLKDRIEELERQRAAA